MRVTLVLAFSATAAGAQEFGYFGEIGPGFWVS